MKQLPNNLLHEGYILIPKALLKRQINDKAPGELEALLQVLIHANYSETTYKIQQIDIVCQRGESVISQQHWSRLFQWSRSKTLRFFQKIQEEAIAIGTNPRDATSPVRNTGRSKCGVPLLIIWFVVME